MVFAGRKSRTMPGLLLALGNALDAAAEDLGEIARVIENERDGGREEAPGFAAAPDVFAQHKAGKIIEHQQLEHQRRAAHDPDDEADDDADGLEVHIAPDLEPLPPRQLRVFRQIFKKRAQKAKRRPVAHGAEGNDQAQRDRADERHEKQLERL